MDDQTLMTASEIAREENISQRLARLKTERGSLKHKIDTLDNHIRRDSKEIVRAACNTHSVSFDEIFMYHGEFYALRKRNESTCMWDAILERMGVRDITEIKSCQSE